MLGTINRSARGVRRTRAWFGAMCCLLLMVSIAVPVRAWMDTEGDVLENGYNPNGIFVVDGSFVMNVG